MPRTPGSRTPHADRRRRLPAWGAALAVTVSGGALLLLPHGADAAPFTGGNLVVYRVGSGSALTNAAAPVFLDEYTASGTKVQSVALPTTSANGNRRLTAVGQSRSEGLISRSADGRFIALTGYDAAVGALGPGGISLTGSTPTSVPRVVGLVDANGTVDTSTGLATASDPKIIRSAATSEGNRLWAAGGNGGVLTQTLGATTHTAITGAGANLTGLTVQGGRLLAGGILQDRLAAVGSGLPTAAGATLTDAPGLPDNLLTYGYGFIDATNKGWAGTTLDTLYIANSSERGGTVDKYSFDGTTWQRAGYLDVPGAFGLVADKSGDGATLAVTTPTELIAISDPEAGASSFAGTDTTTLATAPSGTEFRGVALAPTAAAGPSLFVRKPVSASSVKLASAGVPVSVLADGPSAISAVSAKLGSGTAKALTKGTGKVWTGTIPFGKTTAGSRTVTITAKDALGRTTSVTRSITVSPIVAPAGTAGPGKRSWTLAPVTRVGTWSGFNTTDSPNGKGLTTAVKGRAVKVKAYGRSLVVTFKRTPSSGYATVTVDGKATTINLYSATANLLSKSWTFSTGAVKSHAVTIVVKGTKTAKSKGTSVAVSSYRVGS